MSSQAKRPRSKTAPTHSPNTMRVSQSRRIALKLVGERRRRNGRMRDLMRSSQALSSLDVRDRAFATRLALGVTATYGALDVMIDAYVQQARHLQPTVRDALEIACYELCWLATPPEVAVSQGVELVRSVAPRAAGLANAVLRRIASDEAPRLRAAREQLCGGATEILDRYCSTEALAQDVSMMAGMPLWLTAELLDSLSKEQLIEFARAQIEPAPVWLVANDLLCKDLFSDLAEKEGLAIKPTELPSSWQVFNSGAPALARLVKKAQVFPADLAAQLVARIASALPGQRLLEIGQGRGTKTALLQLATQELGGSCDIVAIDSEPGKVKLSQRRLATARLDAQVRSSCMDGRQLGDAAGNELGEFDVVFLDAPCSGTGTLRRHPEIVWNLLPEALRPDNSQSLPALQLQLLRAAATRVKSAGTLVYATCSVLKAENEEIIEAFLATPEGSAFTRESICAAPGITHLNSSAQQLVRAYATEDGTLRTYPQRDGCDGHFCARLVRV